jgi:hypothetical protein
LDKAIHAKTGQPGDCRSSGVEKSSSGQLLSWQDLRPEREEATQILPDTAEKCPVREQTAAAPCGSTRRSSFALLIAPSGPATFVRILDLAPHQTVDNMLPNTTTVSVRPHRRWKKITATILVCLFVLWTGLVTFLWRAMHRSPEDFARVMSHMPWEIFLVVPFETLWTRARAGTVQVGDAAPDFSLTKLDKSGTIRLSELNKTQPVVMIFGSYT